MTNVLLLYLLTPHVREWGCVRGLSDVGSSLKLLNWAVLEKKKEKKKANLWVMFSGLTFFDPAPIIFSTPRKLRNTLLVSVAVERTDRFFFFPLHIVFHHWGPWSFELFVSSSTFIHFFLKLKVQSRRFQLEKCGASKCAAFNSRTVSWVYQRGTKEGAAFPVTRVN